MAQEKVIPYILQVNQKTGTSTRIGREVANPEHPGTDVLAVGLDKQGTEDLIARAKAAGITSEEQLKKDLSTAWEW